jgi:hypothetical protein
MMYEGEVQMLTPRSAVRLYTWRLIVLLGGDTFV